MWFLLRRQNKPKPHEEADKALMDAEKNLRRVKRRGKEVNDLSNTFKEIREQNHFVEQMEEIIRRRGRGPGGE